VHRIGQGPHLHISHGPDKLCDAEAFETSWKVSKPGFTHRAEQVLRRRFRSNIWPVRRTNVGALLEL
jgi:hypothetical protein